MGGEDPLYQCRVVRKSFDAARAEQRELMTAHELVPELLEPHGRGAGPLAPQDIDHFAPRAQAGRRLQRLPALGNRVPDCGVETIGVRHSVRHECRQRIVRIQGSDPVGVTQAGHIEAPRDQVRRDGVPVFARGDDQYSIAGLHSIKDVIRNTSGQAIVVRVEINDMIVSCPVRHRCIRNEFVHCRLSGHRDIRRRCCAGWLSHRVGGFQDLSLDVTRNGKIGA